MYVSDYNTLFFHHHPQCTDDVIKVHAITGESTGDFSVDFSGDCIRCSHLRFHYMSSSLTAPQMFCRTRLLEVFRLLVLGDAVLISCRVSSQHTQHSFCILLQVSHNNKLSTSVDACSALFFGWFFLDIIIRSCELLSPYQYLLASSISLACVRGCDEHHERQLFFVRFCSCGSLMVCNLFFYTHFRLAEVSDRDIFNELLIPVGSVPTRMSGNYFISTMVTCSRVCVDIVVGHNEGDSLHAVNVTCDGEFLEAGIQQLANIWSWDRTSARKFIGSLCELGAASIETKANRTCIRLTNIEGSDLLGHLTHLSLSLSNFVYKRLNLSRWPTATPRRSRGHRCRSTALYGSVPRRSLMALARQNALHSLSLIRTFRNFLQIQKCSDPYLRAASWGQLLGQGKSPEPLISS